MHQKARAWNPSWPAPSFFRSRVLMCCAICFAGGVALSMALPFGLWMPAALVAALVLGVCMRRVRQAALALAMIAMLLMGLTRAAMEWAVPALPEESRWTVTGTVSGSAVQGANGASFLLSGVQVRDETGKSAAIDSNVYCYATAAPGVPFRHGQRVQVQGVHYLTDGARNPGGFDQRMWLAQKGAHVRMYLTAAPKVIGAAGFSVLGLAIDIRETIGARLDALFGEVSPVVRAMLLGDRTEVPGEWSRWMSDSGIIHLLAVSGLHVGLWYVLLDRMLRPLPISPGARWWLLTALLSAYALVTGLSASVLRAALMLLAVQGAYVAKRKIDPLTSLSIAALGILLFRPLDLFAASFQLSFCAVFGLVLLRPTLRRVLPERPDWLWGGFSTTASAQVGILPASAFWFGRVSVAGLAVNLVAVPLAGLLIPVAAAATALDAVWTPLGWLPALAGKGMATVLLLCARVGAAMPYGVLRVPAFAWWATAAFFFGLFLCSTAVVWRWRYRVLCMAICACMAAGAGVWHGDFGVRYVQLDVGQALSGVLHAGGKTYVYDCGNANSDLTEYLIYCGADVEGLFLSHPHADHIGGLAELLDAEIPVRTVYVPANAEAFGAEAAYRTLLTRAWEAGAEVVEVAAGDTLSLGGLMVEVIAPEREVTRGSDPNDRSVVLRVNIGTRALLLCGDADGTAEPLGVDCDVLQVAHHGSKNAARAAFLADATPDVALISVGRNSYGHPDGNTLERLSDVGAAVYQTQESGALTVYFSGDRIKVEAYCP